MSLIRHRGMCLCGVSVCHALPQTGLSCHALMCNFRVKRTDKGPRSEVDQGKVIGSSALTLCGWRRVRIEWTANVSSCGRTSATMYMGNSCPFRPPFQRSSTVYTNLHCETTHTHTGLLQHVLWLFTPQPLHVDQYCYMSWLTY